MWKSKAFYNARQPLPGYRDVTSVYRDDMGKYIKPEGKIDVHVSH